jgi:hypothetical protein
MKDQFTKEGRPNQNMYLLNYGLFFRQLQKNVSFSGLHGEYLYRNMQIHKLMLNSYQINCK